MIDSQGYQGRLKLRLEQVDVLVRRAALAQDVSVELVQLKQDIRADGLSLFGADFDKGVGDGEKL